MKPVSASARHCLSSLLIRTPGFIIPGLINRSYPGSCLVYDPPSDRHFNRAITVTDLWKFPEAAAKLFFMGLILNFKVLGIISTRNFQGFYETFFTGLCIKLVSVAGLKHRLLLFLKISDFPGLSILKSQRKLVDRSKII
jgi:hypothetical protein